MISLGGCGAGFCRARASAGVGDDGASAAVGTLVGALGSGADLMGAGETMPGSGGLLAATDGGVERLGFACRAGAFRFGILALTAGGG